MTFAPVKQVAVYYQPDNEKMRVGRLVLKERQLFFQYDAAFIATGLQLSPFKLPLQPGVIAATDRTFDGLFGVFNDTLPDGWGHLLLDRQLAKQGLNPGLLSPLDRLCWVGQQGMGALRYAPERGVDSHLAVMDLDAIADAIQTFQENDDERFIDDLLRLGGSSGGARPKILLNLDGTHWLIKFQSATDPKDIGNIEYGYHLMAIAAGLNVSEAKLLPTRKGTEVFGTQRFDRTDNQSFHMHTISGLLHADHRLPSLDYETIMKVTWHLTQDQRACQQQFRRCAFNVLSHNRDDHGKNFSFLMTHDGTWQLAPAYDLTFSSGPSGEHCSMVMGEGSQPTLTHLLKLAAIGSINQQDALAIIDEVKAATSQWPALADEAKVSARSTQMIHAAIQKQLLNK